VSTTSVQDGHLQAGRMVWPILLHLQKWAGVHSCW